MSPLAPSRPELLGTHGAVASTHWLASHAGMSMLEAGGSAADAVAAAGFVLQLVEPHMCGPGGDLPVIVGEPDGSVHVVCGQGPVPAAANVDEFRRRGFDRVPGSGVLAAVVPGAFGGWMTLLERWGRLRLREVLSPAMSLADGGFPISAEAAGVIGYLADHFRAQWPSSAATWLTETGAPAAGTRWRLPGLAATWSRLLSEAEGDGSHDRATECARAQRAWHEGFVAAAVDEFSRQQDGLLTGADLASWQPTVEAPVSYDYQGWTVCKAGPWSQGPVFLQQLALLRGFDLGALAPDSADYVHVVAECMKLAFADREAWYGDPDQVDVPLRTLLSDEYNDERRRLVDPDQASAELRPGSPDRRAPHLPSYDDGEPQPALHLGGTGEPTSRTTGPRDGDTVHVDAVDADGLLISATPSGGWLQSSPVIPALGFCLGSRAQMLWVEDGLAASVAPRKRPRTTLTPSLALRDGKPALAFGTPGGDQQDQWSLLFFLRHVHGVTDLQAAVDAPAFHSEHHPNSFWPRQARPNRLVIEARHGDTVIDELRRRGHDVEVAGDFTLGRVTAVADDRRQGGWARAAATSRGRQAYAVAR